MRHNTHLIVAALCCAELTSTFEASMIYAALPTLLRHFGDPVLAGWFVTIYFVVGAGSALIVRPLRRPARPQNSHADPACSGLRGIDYQCCWRNILDHSARARDAGDDRRDTPSGNRHCKRNFEKGNVPLGVGFIVTASSIGTAMGLILGGAIVDNFHWQWLFAASAIMLALSMALVWIAATVAGCIVVDAFARSNKDIKPDWYKMRAGTA